MRRAAKVDANHGDVVQGLIDFGASVTSLAAVGNGCPDLLVGFKGCNVLLEIKDGSLPPSARKFKPKQKTWHAAWRGKAHVVNSLEEALYILKNVGRG